MKRSANIVFYQWYMMENFLNKRLRKDSLDPNTFEYWLRNNSITLKTSTSV